MKKVIRAVRTEFLFSLSFVLLGIFVLYDAATLEESGVYSAVSPKAFEIIIGSFATLVGAFLLWEVVRGKLGIPEGTNPGDTFLKPDLLTMSIVLGAILLHAIFLEKTGYIAAATFTFYSVAFAFGARKFIKDFLIAFAFAVIVYITFSRGLRIYLPEGFIEDILQLSRPKAG